ncbi:MAG: DUF5110 domain-containing protein, partial [Eubacterium sp.]|nr:DUF5110 domain-containing protein [Eubacterium sp.]
NKSINMGSVAAWIPDGEYTDIFTLQKYRGSELLKLNRELYSIPVLAKAGAVIPLSADEGNFCGNPENLEVWVFKGNNEFVMYEDDGKTDFDSHTAETIFKNTYDELANTAKLTIEVKGDTSVIPKNRQYKICFKDIDTDVIVLDYSDEAISIEIKDVKPLEKESLKERVINVMSRLQGENMKKEIMYRSLDLHDDRNSFFRALYKAKLPAPAFNWIYEILSEI